MSFSETWNYLTDISAYNCAEPDPVIYFTTFGPAVAPAIIDFISYGCRDIIKFKAGVGQPCGRLFKGLAQKTWGLKQLDAFGKLFKFTGPIDAALFWFFVADLASDTAARWTSLAYKLNGCQIDDDTWTWQYEANLPQTFLPNHPQPIGGLVRNLSPATALVYPTGVQAPRNWYVNLDFTAHFRSIFDNRPVEARTWVSASGFGPYDFPASVFTPGYGRSHVGGGYHLKTQAADRASGTLYTMYCEVSEPAILVDFDGHGSASRLPQLNWSLSPLSCLRDMTIGSLEDPRGINRPSRQMTTLDPFLPPPVRPQTRGLPGGKPRSRK